MLNIKILYGNLKVRKLVFVANKMIKQMNGNIKPIMTRKGNFI